MLPEILLGFDVRESPAVMRGWDRERVGPFLLHDDVHKPLSTDRMVWPSILEGKNIAIAEGAFRRDLGLWVTRSALIDHLAHLEIGSWWSTKL